MDHLNELEKPFKLKYKVIGNKVKKDDKHIYLEPLSYLNIDRVRFVEIKRKLPIDLNYGIDLNYTVMISIPENYQTDEIPLNKEIIDDKLKIHFKYSIKIINNIIQLQYQLKILETEYSALDYPLLKKFLDSITEKEKELIVLKIK